MNGTIPWEAFDPTHSDHVDWVRATGRCLAGEKCPHHGRASVEPQTVDEAQ